MIYARAGIIYEQSTRIHRDFSSGIELHERTIHGPGRWSFEVHTLAVISASMAGTLEFIFSRLPFRSASQVRTPRENNEQAVRLPNNPNAIGHQEPLIDSQREVTGKADIKNRIGFV